LTCDRACPEDDDAQYWREQERGSRALEMRVYIFTLLLTPIMLLDEEETLKCYLSGPELLLSPFSAL
jgi:hypothetical protein